MTSSQDNRSGANVLITGPPGIGKTTAMIRLVERLPGRSMVGFYTEEIRLDGRRQGFRIVTLSGSIGVLADRAIKSRARVGRYGVDVAGFEGLVIPELARPADLILIDEIGKMECFSDVFVDTVRDLLDGPVPVVATVAAKGGGFIAEIKARPDVQIRTVSRDNRDELPDRLAPAL